MQSRSVTLVNTRGLHARVAKSIVELTKGFAAQVSITCQDNKVDGKSIMALLMLGAPVGTELQIETDGPDEEACMESLVALVEAGFHELAEDDE